MEEYGNIYVQAISASAKDGSYLLIHDGHYYEVSHAVVELLDCLRLCSTRQEAVAAFVEKRHGAYSADQVEKLIATYVDPILTVSKSSTAKRTFIYQRELLSAAVIDKLSDMFSLLFHKAVIWPVICVAIAADVWFFATSGDLLVFDNNLNAYMAMGLLLFMFVSSLFHELGHASACKHYGLRHGGVGFGLYLNFPVLYTDVTEVWRLKRGKRCVVNIAGVYFQMYILIVLIVIYWLAGHDMARYMILMMNLGFVMTLNPFFKFDGYWLASDILGIPNLRSRSREWLAYLWRKVRGKPVLRKPYMLKVGKAARCGLAAYSVVVNLFMAYYMLYVLPLFVVGLVKSFPAEMKQLVLYLSNDVTPPFAVIRNIAMQFLLLALVVLLVINLIKMVVHRARLK